MKTTLLTLLSFLTIIAYSQEEWTSDFEFETITKDADKIRLIVTIRYRIISQRQNQLFNRKGPSYIDKLMLPVISAVSKEVLKDYSTGEIYNSKRAEVEQKLGEQTKKTLVQHDLQLTEYLIRSIKLPDAVNRRLLEEYP